MASFRNVVCPVSDRRIDLNASRLTVLICTALLVVFILTGNMVAVGVVAADYFIRAIGQGRFSPIRWISAKVLGALNVAPKMADEAPKLFASRIGFTFAALALVTAPFAPTVSLTLAGVLALFAFLDGALNFCVGCLTYHYIVFPWLGKPKLAS